MTVKSIFKYQIKNNSPATRRAIDKLEYPMLFFGQKINEGDIVLWASLSVIGGRKIIMISEKDLHRFELDTSVDDQNEEAPRIKIKSNAKIFEKTE